MPAGRVNPGRQGVPAALPCERWHWDMLLLVAPGWVLPKQILSPASTEGRRPDKDPTNSQARQGSLCTFRWGLG